MDGGRDLAPSAQATPDQLLERHAMRDWLWRAIEDLSPPVRLVMVLRHFSERVTSYEEIARAAGCSRRLRLTRRAQLRRRGDHGRARHHARVLRRLLGPDVIDDRALLGSLAVPALVLVGRDDVICGVRWAGELHEGIPDSRLVVFERSGHFAHLEEPQAFARVRGGLRRPLRPAGRSR